MCSPSIGATKPVNSPRFFLAIRKSPYCWAVAHWLTGKGAACGRARWVGAVPPGSVPQEYVRNSSISDSRSTIACISSFRPSRSTTAVNIDPARATLRYEAISYDPFIEQIALAMAQELSAETSAGRLLVESLGLSLSAYLVLRYSEVPLIVKPLRSSGSRSMTGAWRA
jgi:hypothetical protein